MKRWLACFLLAASAPAQTPAGNTVVMEDLNLYLHSSDPSFGEIEDPTFWVHAARGEQLDGKRWALEGAKAVIYRKPEDDLVLVAETGTLDQDGQTAKLAGGVQVTSGPMAVQIEEIAWDEAQRVARSDYVATLSHGDNRIVGDSIAIFPDDDRVELGGGTATIQLAAAEDTEKKRESAPTDIYKRLDIEEQHGTSGSLKGAPLQKIQGPVRMSLIGKLPEDTLTIRAGLVTLEYGNDPEVRTPTRVLLTGGVEIKQAASLVKSDTAELDLAGRKARFNGNVTITGDQIANGSGPFLDMDLETGVWTLGGPGGVMSFDFTASESAKDKQP